MKVWKKTITINMIFLLWAWTPIVSFSQSKIKVTLEIIDLKKESEQKSFFVKDSLQVVKRVSNQLYQLYFQGYLGAAIVGEQWENGTHSVEIFKGEQYQLKKLAAGNISPAILSAVGFKEKKNMDRPFRYHEIESIFEKVLDHAENSGYPFAVVKLDSLEVSGKEISACLSLRPGPRILFDSLTVKGYSKIKEEWLASFLGIVYDQPYRERSVNTLSERLKDLPFVSLVGEPRVIFSKDRAKVILELRPRKINSIDGVIGFLPNASDDSKLLLTGNLNLHLHNLFSSAKQLHLDWQKVQVNSQVFDFRFFYPQLFKIPVGIGTAVHFLKEDTLYFNRNFAVSLNFTPASAQKISVTTEWESSRLTGTVSEELASQFNDYDVTYYGVAYQINKLNNPFLPTSGWYASLDGMVGKKTFLVQSFAEDSLSQGQDKNTAQYKISGHFEWFFPISKSYVVRTRLLSGILAGKNLFTNDLFRIGGLNSLRGFNENFFFVSDYGIANLELRLRGGEETYFFAFYDQAIVNNKRLDFTEYPFGAGIGMNLSTKTGIFNFIFALGKSQSQNFSINSAKIHFGYVGRF